MESLKNYRNYNDCNSDVIECYRDQRKNQSLNFVKYALKKYCVFDKKTTFWDLFDKLSDFKDLSDPDINLSNHHHLFQTAEGIRSDGFPDWMQLVGLMHDLGKVLYLKGCYEDGTSMNTQWGIVGDTFITGCRIPDTIVFNEFNILNADMEHHEKKTKLGVYKKNIGLENVYCSFGHDEYLYRLLKFNNIRLPEEAYYMIRYHSLYLWHKENEYKYFENEKDKKMKGWVKLFNQYDLYTKQDIPTDLQSLRKFYSPIVNKYFPKEFYY
jgi:inositol oxygenase